MKDDVLRLDVSMDNLQRMYFVDGIANLPHDEGDSGF